MKYSVTLFLSALCCTAALASPVKVTMGSFLPSSTVITFDAIADGEKIVNQYAGVVFAGLPGAPPDPGLFGEQFGGEQFFSAPGTQIATNGPSGVNCCPDISITFASPVNRIGFQSVVGLKVSGVTVDAYRNGQLLASLFYANVPFNEIFVGIEDLGGMDRVVVRGVGESHYMAFNDVRYDAQAPEPSTMGLLGCSLLAIGCLRRRRVNG